MSTTSKRSRGLADTALSVVVIRAPFPRLDQLCLNELLTHDHDLALYLRQEDLVERGKLETSNRMPPPEQYRGCAYALEDIYRHRPLFFSLPHLYGQHCQHPRCVGYGTPREIGLSHVPFLPRYLVMSRGGHLLWRCHPDQPYSACRWDNEHDLVMRARKAKRNGFNLVVWDLERPSGI